ncbi:peptide chain release factor 1 [Histoplasma capsulatum var. duboisii H88]|uniref:Peptide chain release factor 1 n=1 Tax=Ajellomyces capsulatus (strain H88) TaxID=544711 RepID=F0UAD4_AJEC8|nr:peptide chain release factor 1 [Histoplasma capsulatum var. duboisii H88]QSS49040.1 peptide chain release factor 1 [Histoplasma capsulatum var. duboisii H88]
MFNVPWVCSRYLIRSVGFTQRKQWRIQLRFDSTLLAPEISISPILLSRARSIADEHSTLTSRLAETFDPKIVKRAGELATTATTLKEWEKANESISELNNLLEDPSTDSELRSLALEDLRSAKASLAILSSNLKQTLIPRHPFADLPCLLELRPGAGGEEAGIFANELLRMYTMFCSNRSLRATLLKKECENAGANGGSEDRLIEAVMEIETPGSYETLRTEAGVHRVQRVPATENKGRTHTSAVSVVILPSFPSNIGEGDSELNFDDPNSDYYIDPQEVNVEKMRAGGAGGQHVNKTESAIRLTHIPTGIVVGMQDSRSQHENRRKAWHLLRARIAQQRREAREEEMVKLRRGVMGGVAKMGRGDKIRTYNFGQNRCTDHRSGLTLHNLGSIMEGGDGLEKIMDSVRGWLVDREVDDVFAEEQMKMAQEAAKKRARS